MKVKEFKIWLEGVLAFQDDRENWKPTAKQWKAISQKIEELEESNPPFDPRYQGQPQGPQQARGQAQEMSLEDYARNPPVMPAYQQYSQQELDAMVRRTQQGLSQTDLIDVKIDYNANAALKSGFE